MDTGSEEKTNGIGARVWLVALAAQVAIILWVVRTEIQGQVFVSSWTLSMPAVLFLLALLAWNALPRRRPFTRAELLAAYVAISSTVTMVGYNFFQALIPTLGTGLYLQTPENHWARVLAYLPAWLLPQDKAALRGLFYGESAVPWRVWIGPLIAWGSLVLAVLLASLALNALLADLWIRRERLAFPIAALPLEMTQAESGFFRNRRMWLGFALPVILNSLLALRYYYPSIPAIELKHADVLVGIETPPLAVLRPLDIGYTPFIIGLAYLAPLDVSFSIWFFLWLGKGARLLAFALGQADAGDLGGTGAPYLNEQTSGGFLAMGLFLVWRAWPRRRDPGDTPDRPLKRVLQLVLVGALAYILLFMRAAGFSLWLAVTLIGLYFLTVAVISRVRSEAGFAWAYGPHRFTSSLSHIVVNAHGTMGLSPQNIALMSFFHWLWWDLRFALMPAQMEALKIGDAARVRRRSLLALLTVATVLAVVVGLAWALHDSYRFGWGTAKTYEGPARGAKQAYNMAVNWMQNPLPTRWDRLLWMAIGGSLTVALGLLHQRFAWWPFHPVGYIMCGTLTAESFWGHYLLAWLVKLLLLRYGGLRFYRQTLPFVFGVILGDITSQTLWSLGASLLNVPVYQFISLIDFPVIGSLLRL
ncbi:MAG TPA: DUF6785 family protein [Chthonomonadaceae bacterium]|nr:DUF6785 family protein [Chthonomonadaceae bacterium]